MNFARELYNKLTTEEWDLCSYYVYKAQDYYDADEFSGARESLGDAVAVCLVKGEESAAKKIEYYMRFC